jgi:hypothetical protein
MSVIDLVVALVLVGIGVAIFFWHASQNGLGRTGMAYGALVVVVLLGLVPLWLYNDRKAKLDLKDSYERGGIDPDYYRQQVGERFWQKHHGEEEG